MGLVLIKTIRYNTTRRGRVFSKMDPEGKSIPTMGPNDDVCIIIYTYYSVYYNIII